MSQREFKPGNRDDVDDLALLPRRFDLFAGEMRLALEIIANALKRIESAIADEKVMTKDLDTRVRVLERKHMNGKASKNG